MKMQAWDAIRVLMISALCAASAFADPANLLTTNPSFESVDFGSGHGDYQLEGWTGSNFLYSGHSVVTGDATDGHKFFHMDWGGMLATAAANRAAVTPGIVYEMRYDLRTLVGRFPDQWLGTISYLDFFDASGNRLKSYWGPDWLPQSQARGVAPWETIVVRGLAPENSAFVGVRIIANGGTYFDDTHNFTENRHIEADNFRVYQINETTDRLALRRFPHLVQPGKPASIAVRYAAVSPRVVAVGLLDGSGVVKCKQVTPVSAGQGLVNVSLTVPGDLKPGSYSWEAELQPEGGSNAPVARLRELNVFCDESVSLPRSGTKEVPADDPHIVRMGRWDDSDPKHPWMNWFASEIRVRFNGTSLGLRASASGNGFGGTKSIPLNVVIDGDESNIKTVNVDRADATFPLVTGLHDAVHTATIFKANEASETIRFDGFALDQDRGLLKPEPLPTRRIEIFGDSVTSGGSASPPYLAYAPMLGRVLNADVHVISKGGTGVAASFGHMVTLLDYWNLLNFPNVFDVSQTPKWNFSSWQPDAVLIAIGHNDQFNGGADKFADRYHTFVTAVREAYPKAHIFCTNTVISANAGQFENAILPLLSQGKNVSFAFQLSPWVDPATGHPPTEAHRAMVFGDKDRLSLADWIEAKMGWGVEAPSTTLMGQQGSLH